MKRAILLLSMIFFCFFVTGCQSTKEVLKEVSTQWKANGREYGEELVYEQGQTAQTAFFDVTINQVTAAEEIEGYVPENSEHQFAVVNITIKNTFEDFDSIPMFCDDFELTWETLEGETTFPEYQFYDGQLPDEYSLKHGESRTGNLVFIVPKDVYTYQMKYFEMWDDNFIGNTYYINFSLPRE